MGLKILPLTLLPLKLSLNKLNPIDCYKTKRL